MSGAVWTRVRRDLREWALNGAELASTAQTTEEADSWQ